MRGCIVPPGDWCVVMALRTCGGMYAMEQHFFMSVTGLNACQLGVGDEKSPFFIGN